MTYAETLDYLFSRLPMYSRIGAAAYKEDLHNTIALLNEVGNPQRKFRTIHIAGTNGKGSVSHMLASVLQEAGYKTGLYTSPHLRDFRERIRINGDMIPHEKVISFTEKMQPAIERIGPSFFELTVAMAFEYFFEEQVDIAVIETGLGGRLDSTNVIVPELSVITNIGWDHMNLLGDTLEKIAFEKAGIIKPRTPVVIGEKIAETEQVFLTKAQHAEAPITWSGSNFLVRQHHFTNDRLTCEVMHVKSGIKHVYSLDLMGIYQLKNLLTVLESIEILRSKKYDIPERALQSGLSQVRALTGFGGRWEVLQKNPLIVLDVAHNTHGMQQVLEQLKSISYRQLHLIMGMVNDKNINGVLEMLPTSAKYYFTQASIPRALPADELRNQAVTHGLYGSVHPNVNEAIEAAISKADKDDLILVTGSIFLVGEVSR